jgi:hypothetical protein
MILRSESSKDDCTVPAVCWTWVLACWIRAWKISPVKHEVLQGEEIGDDDDDDDDGTFPLLIHSCWAITTGESKIFAVMIGAGFEARETQKATIFVVCDVCSKNWTRRVYTRLHGV